VRGECDPAPPRRSPNLAAVVAPVIAAGSKRIALHVAACAGASAAVFTRSYMGSLLEQEAVASLEVEYCLNAACVSPKFLGSPAYSVVPRLQNGVWRYGGGARRAQEASAPMTASAPLLQISPATYFRFLYRAGSIADMRLTRIRYYEAIDLLRNVRQPLVAPLNLPTEKEAIAVPTLQSQVTDDRWQLLSTFVSLCDTADLDAKSVFIKGSVQSLCNSMDVDAESKTRLRSREPRVARSVGL